MVTRLAAVALVLAAAACGGSNDVVAGPPPRVPVALAPPSLTGGSLTLSEDDQATEAFSQLGDRALVADGRLWQIRHEDRLVATLQISTVKPKVDLADAEQRTAIVNHILPGTRVEIDVNGLAMWVSDSNDKTVYVWFGRDLFQVLQVKSTTIDPEAVVSDLVDFQLRSPDWNALPVAADE